MSSDLQIFRDQLNSINEKLIDLLAERFTVTEKVGKYKAANNLPPQDKAREAAIISRVRELAQEKGVDPDLAEQIMTLLMDAVVKRHQELQTKSLLETRHESD
jgi:chorismate mutase